MKRLLSLLAILTISTPVALSVTACGHSQVKEPVYNSIEDGVKSLKLNSYVPLNTIMDTVKENLKLDMEANLMKLKFADHINLKYLNYNDEKFELEILEIIKSDGTILSDGDIKNINTLNIHIICKLNGRTIYLNNFYTLNIVENNKTDQEVVDYFLNLNFNNIFNSVNFPIFAGTSLDYFLNTALGNSIFFVGGSYLFSYMDTDKLKQNQVLNDNTGKQLSQSDLNQAGNLKLTINFDYGEIKNQNLNLNLIFQKFDFSKIKFSQDFNEIDVEVKNPENLTEDDVTEINVRIIQEILKYFKYKDFYLSIDDFAIQGIEKIVYEGADFSAPKVVFLDLVAQPNSKMLMGTLQNNFITVNVTAS